MNCLKVDERANIIWITNGIAAVRAESRQPLTDSQEHCKGESMFGRHGVLSPLRLGLVLAPGWILLVTAWARASDSAVRVKLQSEKPHYLLGEPVLLSVRATNAGDNAIKAREILVENCEPEIEVYISSQGGLFKQYNMGIYPAAKVGRAIKTLSPNKSWSYSLGILYTYKRPDRLAFPEPGDYRIKVRYPLITPKSSKRTEFESNTIAIRVKSPEGDDRKLWRQTNAPEFLYFLQSGLDPKQGKQAEGDIPMKAVRLVKKYPKSNYADALNWALKEHYRNRRRTLTRDEALADKEMELIREATGIKEPPPGPFPDDPRLEVPITYHYPKQTPLREVFEDLSQQSGTPLRLDQALTIRSMQSAAVTQPLRKFMDSMDAYKAKWIEDGDGYKLVPDEPPAKDAEEPNLKSR